MVEHLVVGKNFAASRDSSELRHQDYPDLLLKKIGVNRFEDFRLGAGFFSISESQMITENLINEIFGVNKENCPRFYLESFVAELGYFFRTDSFVKAKSRKALDSSSIILNYINYLIPLKYFSRRFLFENPTCSNIPMFLIACLKASMDKDLDKKENGYMDFFTDFLKAFSDQLNRMNNSFQKEEFLKLLIHSRNIIFGSISGYSVIPNTKDSIPSILLTLEKLSESSIKNNYSIEADSETKVFKDLALDTPLYEKLFTKFHIFDEEEKSDIFKKYLALMFPPVFNPLVEMGLYFRAFEDGIENFEPTTLATIYGIPSEKNNSTTVAK